jgi:FtsP/CotA-like multicopper oxidase with cupredoxin domain
VRLAAGERADVVITAPSEEQGPFQLIAEPINLFDLRRQSNGVFDPLAVLFSLVPPFHDPEAPQSVLNIKVEGKPAEPVRLPEKLASFPSPTAYDATRDFSISMQVTPTPGASFPVLIKYPVNGHLYPNIPRPEEKLGTWVLHRWTNESASPHPIHLHGFRFLVLKRNGIPEQRKGWKDTVELSAFGSVEFALDLREGYPGDWLHHCHFENHMEDGFMGSFLVRDPKNPSNFPEGRSHDHSKHH